jgi:hypothetical protein
VNYDSLPYFCTYPFVQIAKDVDLPSWVVPSVSLVSALFVAVANYAIQRWRYRIDRISAAVDHLCGEINLAADASTRYWLLDTTQKSDALKSKELEPELIGRQMRLQSLVIALKTLDPSLNLAEAEDQLALLFEAMTGENFQVSNRKDNPAQAKNVQCISAILNGELRNAIGLRSRDYF